ncbi:uncharacterized protein CXorf49 homolog [Cervus canadensis]|uniref:uncharacterized protein CXorf49 homolog n=1 Tax=Cervus canadensis TaxID=1574408 RepID=UPI001CA313B4|nr:uncharacterized protein CXorf49 homolog [Cervus canadensis]
MRRRQLWHAESLTLFAAISCLWFRWCLMVSSRRPPASPTLTTTTADTATWLINRRRRPRSGGHLDCNMSSPDDEVSVSGAGFSSECREQTSGLEAGSAAPRGPTLAPAAALSRGHCEAARLADLNVLGTRRYLSQESYVVGEVSALWDLKARPRSRGGAAQTCGETAQADAVPLQLTTDRPWPTSPSVPHGESGRANLNIRGTQDSGNSETVAMNKGEVRPRGPGPSGDQEPTDHPPRLKRRQQPPGRQGCPQCLVLQKEIDDLKEQLASKRYLADKFQIFEVEPSIFLQEEQLLPPRPASCG